MKTRSAKLNKTKLAIAILTIIFVAGLFSLNTKYKILNTAHAQEVERTFTISPPGVEVKLDPGAQTQGVLKIINDGDSPRFFKTSMQDFIVKDDEGTPDILPPDTLSNKYSGASWVAIYPNVVTVEPHKKAELNYYVQVPSDAKPGGHYAAVMYTPTTSIGVNGTGAAVDTSVGTLFYITVNGPVSFQAQLTKFLTKGLWDFGPVTVDSQIMNMSDLHIRPTGTVTLTNMFGQKSATAKIAENNIFPGVARNYHTKLGKKFMLGVYKASLTATYGPNNNVLAGTTSFIVFPWKIAVFLILTILVLFFGYRYWKRRPVHHEEPPTV